MDTRKVYYLKNCDTSRRVIREARLPDDFVYQDIKENPLSAEQVDQLAVLAGSYEALFSRRSREYHKRDLKSQHLNEKDYRDLILEHYSFLKRPVIVVDNQIYIGGDKKEVARLVNHLENR